MLNIHDPIHMSVAVLALVFLLTLGVLYLAKPGWVLVMDKSTGKQVPSFALIVPYSVTFALVTAIATLIFMTKNNKSEESLVDATMPSPTMVLAYCGGQPH